VSFESDERQIRASLGLHRGRRALGLVLLAIGGLAVLLRAGARDEQPVLVTPPAIESPVAPAVPPQANRAPVRRRAVGKQTAHAPSPVRAAAPVASSPERSAPPSADRPAPSAPPEPPAESVPPPPVVQADESAAARQVDVAAAPDEPPAEPLPESAAGEGSGEAIARAIAAAKRAAVRNCFEH
jgi:hypothetical protein